MECIQLSPNFISPSIVTNKPTNPTRSLLNEFRLINYFHHVVGIDYLSSHGSIHRFSSKEFAIRHLLGSSDPVKHVIYIGDTLADRDRAIKAGCNFVAVNYGFHAWSRKDTENLLCVDSVFELTNYFSNITPIDDSLSL